MVEGQTNTHSQGKRSDAGKPAISKPRKTKSSTNGHSRLTKPDEIGPNLRRLTLAQESEDTSSNQDREDEANEAEENVCFICANVVDYWAVTPCNHRTCHVCSLRLRALYKTKACAHCRTEQATVIYSANPTKRFLDYSAEDIVYEDIKLGIKFDYLKMRDDVFLLLRYNCPDPSCDVACSSWPGLHRHVRTAHDRLICDLCARFKRVFTHEHVLLTQKELNIHERNGDEQGGAADLTGFRGHPKCQFCRIRFYDSDALFLHCRDEHEKCHICERQRTSNTPNYYRNYDMLEEHFRHDHFICTETECLANKFVVFGSEIDLKAHQLEVHPQSLSAKARKDAQRIEVEFAGGQGYRRRQQALRGRLPNELAGLSREEQALHRSLAVANAHSQNAREFGSRLTDAAFTRHGPLAPIEREQSRMPSPERQSDFPSLGVSPSAPARSGLSSPRVSSRPQTPRPEGLKSPKLAARTPEDLAKHKAVIERAISYLRNDTVKLAVLRQNIKKIHANELTARQFVDTIAPIFDMKVVELGKWIREFGDLFEGDTRRTDLLMSYNDWKVRNEYPSFPGSIAQGVSAAKGSRVLKLKSRTTPSRNQNASQNVWNRVSKAAAPITRAPVQQSPSARPTALGITNERLGQGLWTNGHATSSHEFSTNTSADHFPALPNSIHQYTDPVTWSRDGTAKPPDIHIDIDSDQEAAGKGKKKLKKQTLFRVG